MDNKTKATEDLQQLLSEVKKAEKEHKHTATEQHEFHDTDLDRRIDVLDLPPRKEVHSKKNKRTQLKLSSPLTRFIFVIVVLLSVLILTYYLNSESF
ncbi:Tfp pilus assembly protein PilN [Virgibacillus halotolerans]|uniref:hypothetical protein n=1 Tax=Virgibacillus halotolerans TaxID=1071053 RepID=UPI001960B54E|nr:hypothetical protein [Virgibacillus halotolerans]MBM7598334.1 Tfp pilus assembly protein PilN [Virgibacillus halotolerans]